MDESTRYLKILGRLYPDNKLKISCSYLTDKKGSYRQDPDSNMIIILYNEQNDEILKYRGELSRYLIGRHYSENLRLKCSIPFPSETHFIRFFYDDICIRKIEVSKGQPKLVLRWNPENEIKGKHRIIWEGEHPDNLALKYLCRYTINDGKSWRPLGEWTEDTEMQVDFEALPGGKSCMIMLVATDGVNTTEVASTRFSVRVKPCIPTIFRPQESSTYKPDEVISFRGQGFYMEELRLEKEKLRWESSIEGKIGEGRTLQKQLKPGDHSITLLAGEKEREGKASVRISVR